MNSLRLGDLINVILCLQVSQGGQSVVTLEIVYFRSVVCHYFFHCIFNFFFFGVTDQKIASDLKECLINCLIMQQP